MPGIWVALGAGDVDGMEVGDIKTAVAWVGKKMTEWVNECQFGFQNSQVKICVESNR